MSSQGLRSGSFIIIIVIVIIAIAGFDKLGPDSSPTKHIIKRIFVDSIDSCNSLTRKTAKKSCPKVVGGEFENDM